jgi:DNA-binding transcriptional MerR regulator
MNSVSSSDFFASDAATGLEVHERPRPSRAAEQVMTIGELARVAGVTLRALRFYQSKGLLAPARNGTARLFSQADRERLALILQGKRLGFTLNEIRGMVGARDRGCIKTLPISRKRCVEQIKLLERERHDLDVALAELRQIYTGMFLIADFSGAHDAPAAKMPCNKALAGKSS